MTVIVATWGEGNVLTLDDETGEVYDRTGPDVDDVIAAFRQPARRWAGGDSVVSTEPGGPGHIRNVLQRIPGAIVT